MAPKILQIAACMAAFCSLGYSQNFSTARTTLESGGFTIGNCDMDDLNLGVTVASPTSTLERRGGLITRSLTSGDAGQDEGPFIGILQTKVVCTAPGTEQGKIGSVSVVVNYVCSGMPFCVGTEERTEQFQFDCTEQNTWHHRIVDGDVRSITPGNFSTPRSDMCGQCVDPESLPNPADPRRVAASGGSHCAACHPDCNTGMQMCVGINPDQCCNWYYNGRCVLECPTGFIANQDTFECGCEPLTVPNGRVVYSDERRAIGSVATISCDSGYVLSSAPARAMVDRNCVESGWSGEEIVCEMSDDMDSSTPTTVGLTTAGGISLAAAADSGEAVKVGVIVGVVCGICFFVAGILIGSLITVLVYKRKTKGRQVKSGVTTPGETTAGQPESSYTYNETYNNDTE